MGAKAAAALAALLNSSNPTGELPPANFDYWPTVPVITINIPAAYIADYCYGIVMAQKVRALGYEAAACSSRLLKDGHSEAIMQAMLFADDLQTRARLKAFSAQVEIQQILKRRPKYVGCIIVLPLPAEVSSRELYEKYRHERAHCNGWTRNHEGARPAPKPKPRVARYEALDGTWFKTEPDVLTVSTSVLGGPGAGIPGYNLTVGGEVPVENIRITSSTFAHLGGEMAKVSPEGVVTCAEKRWTAEEAKQHLGSYAGVYLALCNPPRPAEEGQNETLQ